MDFSMAAHGSLGYAICEFRINWLKSAPLSSIAKETPTFSHCRQGHYLYRLGSIAASGYKNDSLIENKVDK
ncbi:hypothetical protein GCM10027567_16380 [Spongiibacter taiwanensis]